MKEFLIIPILIVAYIYFVNLIVQGFPIGIIPSPTLTPGAPGAQIIGIGEAITVTVTRPYLFGLIRLPVYTNTLGYIGTYHEAFFVFIVVLTIALFIRKLRYKKVKRGERMPKKAWGNYLKAIVFGIIFAIIAYILSGDASSIVVGLLVMYLEYKLGKR